MHSPLQPWLMEVVDPNAGAIVSADAYRLPAQMWTVVLAACGKPSVVERHAADLPQLAESARADSFAALSDAEKSSLLGRIREFAAHARGASPAAVLFRISALPAEMADCLARTREIADRHQLPFAALVRASGLIFAALLPAEKDGDALRRLAAAANEIFLAVDKLGARAMIEWCPAELKQAVNVWGSPRPDLAVMRKLKSEFDPNGILSPGRFYGGI
jgi:FAD/FMN-containing dehydrogenase